MNIKPSPCKRAITKKKLFLHPMPMKKASRVKKAIVVPVLNEGNLFHLFVCSSDLKKKSSAVLEFKSNGFIF
jgi:hypothetical protein